MLWTALSWLLFLLAIVIGVRALFWDRPGFRGRPALRCRKCWYDLTTAAGIEKANKTSPVTCPECGKPHTKRRAMERTRRSTRGMLATLTLGALSYAAGTWPSIQHHGWDAVVPRIVIVLSAPFVSETQGPGLPRVAIRDTDRPTGYQGWLLGQTSNGQVAETPYQGPEYGWLSRRLLFALAKLESYAVISDGTTVKGNVYKPIISHLVHTGQATRNEERWARSVAYAEGEGIGVYASGQMVYGHIRIRRLVSGPYEFTDLYSHATYRCFNPSSMSINGIVRARTPEAIRSHWIERFAWDQVSVVDRAGSSDTRRFPLGFSQATHTGEATLSVRLRLRDTQTNRITVPSFNNEVMLSAAVTYTSDPDRTIQEDASPQLRQHLEHELTARLTLAPHRARKAWVPAITIGLANPRATHAEEIILFGGNLTIEQVTTVDGQEYRSQLHRSVHPTWWAWNKQQPKFDDEPTHPWWHQPTPGRVTTIASTLARVPGELSDTSMLPRSTSNNTTRFVVRIKPSVWTSHHDFGGLWGDRVYAGELELPLRTWTADEMKRFIISGTLPDHAMP